MRRLKHHKRALLVISVLMMVLILSSLLWLIMNNSIHFIPIYKKTFTWVAHTINDSMAKWCSDLNFTDVVNRCCDGNESISVENLEKYGITYWSTLHVSLLQKSTSIYETYPTEYFVSKLSEELNTIPTKKLFLDDCQYVNAWTNDSLNNLLEAVRVLQEQNEGEFVLAFFVYNDIDKPIFSNANMTDINVEFYSPPSGNIQPFTQLVTKAKSIGNYLWAWGNFTYGAEPVGVFWDKMTETMIDEKYKESENLGCSRMGVWDGYETDDMEKGLSKASLFNYPTFWNYIKLKNIEYLQSNSGK